jgi:molybdopterin converting factor small subunit
MVNVNVSLVGVLARAAENSTKVEAETLGQVLGALVQKYGEGFGERILDDGGGIRRFINIYVDGRDYRFLGKLDAKLSEGSEVSIIPAVSGG